MEDQGNKPFPFSEEFQYAILKLMFTDDTFALKSQRYLREEYFNNKYLMWVFRTISRFLRDYGQLPDITTLENEARKHEVKDHPVYFSVLKKIVEADVRNSEYVKRELTGFIRNNIFVQTFNQAAGMYNAKHHEDVYTFTNEKISQLLEVDFNADAVVDFDKIEQYIEEAKEMSRYSVPTGILPIDKALPGGGMTPGSLTVLLSATNAGKSMALVNVAYHAIMANKKVVFIEHEDEEKPTIMRFLSRFTGISFNKLVCSSDVLDSIEKSKIEAAKKVIKTHLVLKFMYGSEITVEDVREWLKIKKKEFDFDLVIDDYGQFITTRVKNDGERFAQSIVHKTLKQTGLELKVAVLTCAQGTREAQKIAKKGVDYLRVYDISEAFAIIRLASNVITLTRSDDHIRNNQLLFYLDKQKSGRTNVLVRCETDFSRCITHDPAKMWDISSISIADVEIGKKDAIGED